jgi:site-specific DNA-methyltransferase (adenine-specific)
LKLHPELKETSNIKRLRALKADGVLDMMQERSISNAVYAQRLVHHARSRAAEAAYRPLTDADIKLFYGDVFTGLPWIKPESVHAIITDPPYARDFVPIYKAIAQLAARVLVPQGLLVVMSGQSHLDKIIRTISEVDGLVYNWTVAYLTRAAGSTYLNQLGVTPYWKPVLLYIKGNRTWTNRLMYSDVIDTPPDKTRQTLHPWQQDEAGFKELVSRFTRPGETVLDPCCGASTTGAACVTLGRAYIGVDIDPDCIKKSRERLLALLPGPE